MAKTPAVMVVDQDIQARFEMKQVVKASGLTLAGECNYGMEAITSAGEYHPDIVLVGVNQPMERPLQTVESLVGLLPDTPILVYSDSRALDSARTRARSISSCFGAKRSTDCTTKHVSPASL